MSKFVPPSPDDVIEEPSKFVPPKPDEIEDNSPAPPSPAKSVGQQDLSGIKVSPGEKLGQDSQFGPASDNFGFTEATGGVPTLALAGKVLGAVQNRIIEPVAAGALNTLSEVAGNEAGTVAPSDEFKPGEPIIPAPTGKGVLPAIGRFASGLTTPGNILTLPLVEESELVRTAFGVQAASSIQPALEKFATAKTKDERNDAATELGLTVGMAALMGKNGGKTPPEELASELGRTRPNLAARLPGARPIVQGVHAAPSNGTIISPEGNPNAQPIPVKQMSRVKPPKVSVPSVGGTVDPDATDIGTIRQANRTTGKFNTIAEIQSLFPRSNLTREQARALRDRAFPKLANTAAYPPVPEIEGQIKPYNPSDNQEEPSPSTPDLKQGERLVTVQKPDGSTYQASFAGKYWQMDDLKIPSIGRIVGDKWSHGMLGEGEKIVGQSDVKTPPEPIKTSKPEALQTPPEIPIKNEPPQPTTQEKPPVAGASLPPNKAPEYETGIGLSAIQSPTAMKYALIDRERQQRGLEPLAKPASVSDQQITDKAISEIDKDPELPNDLVRSLNSKPRTIDAWENQVLLLHKIDLRSRLNAASKESVDAFEAAKLDPSKQSDSAVASARANKISAELDDVERASKVSGSERGRALRSLQIMANEDYSLAAMETRTRAAKGGQPLTDTERADLQKTASEYAAKNAELENHLAGYQEREKQASAMAAADALTKTGTYSSGVIKIAQRIVDGLDKSANEARARIRERMTRTSAGIDPTILADAAIIGASHIARIGLDFAKWSDAMVDEFGDSIKPHLKGVFKKSQSIIDRQGVKNLPRKARGILKTPLDTVKANLKKQIEEYQRRINDSDFSKRPKQKVELDKTAQRLTAEKEAIVKRYKAKLREFELASRPRLERAFDLASNIRRFSVLSGVSVLGKLAAYSATKVPTMALGELSGKVFKLPGINERAPSEGQSSLPILSRAVAKGLTKGFEDAWKTIRTGSSDLKSAFSPRADDAWHWYNIPQQIHEVIKSPLRRIAFENSLAKRMNFAAKNGADITDPMTQLALAKDAYLDSDRALLLEQNRVADAIRNSFRILERADKKTGKVPFYGKTMATVGKIEFPILTVPFNYVKQTLENAFGLITGSAKYASAVRDGLDKLKPEEADAIARQFKYGAIGAGMLLWGFFDGYNNGQNGTFGGFYEPGERRNPNQAGVSGAKIGGVKIPGILLHNPMVSVAQFGHTIGAIAASKLNKKSDQSRGVPVGVVAGMFGLLNQSPVGSAVELVSQLENPSSTSYALGEHAKGILVPQIMQEAANEQDKDKNGNTIRRNPQTVLQHVETGIPYLREEVPIKGPRR